MLTAYRTPYDPLARPDLRRDDTVPPAVRGGRLAFKIAVGAGLGVLLATVGNMAGERPGTIDRSELAWTRPAPEITAEPKSPWGDDTP